ncbi:MAG: hypothetical protein K2M87_06910 [Muribaculaceae bacterium]|nr:hypothetical protein [Muribaculaceae bacterium]
MRPKKQLTSLFLAFCTGIMLLWGTSCERDTIKGNEQYEIIDPVDPATKPQVETVDAPTALIGNFGTSEAELKSCFTNIVSPEQAKIIIIQNDAIKANEEILTQAYNKGSLIAVFDPEESEVSEWCKNNNMYYTGPEKGDKCSVYSFNNKGTSYTQQVDDIGDEEVPLFYFCLWANKVTKQRYQNVDLRSVDIKRRFMPQTVTHTFNISLDKQALIKGHWGDPEQLDLSTTASITCNIYPLHVFDGNAKGDYYAVEGEMVLYNSALNNGKWARRYGNQLTEICGFYLNRCDLSANLIRKFDGSFYESFTQRFPTGASPKPASTDDAAIYNPGFDWAIQGMASGGIPDSKDNYKMTTSADWKWNSNSEAELAGIAVKNSDNYANVGYSLMVNGLPGATDNLSVTPVPDIATGEIKFKFSWIWYVPDAEEESDDRFYMQVGINPIYQAYKWITGGKMTIGEFENALPQSKSVYRLPLTPPNRVATCSTIIRNTSEGSYFISDIKFWRNKSTDKEPDYIVPQTICTSGATGGSGVNATMLMLPAGEYTVRGLRYSMENDQRVNEHVITNLKPITLKAGGNATIDFGSDIFTIL